MPKQQQQHPMQPTERQLREWLSIPPYQFLDYPELTERFKQIYQAGADAQLEEVRKRLAIRFDYGLLWPQLYAAMRPAPPTRRELRDAALKALNQLAVPSLTAEQRQEHKAAILAALEALPVEDPEQ